MALRLGHGIVRENSGDARLNAIAGHVRTWIERSIAAAPAGHVPLLFLSGPQGSGKSTALGEAIAALPVPVAGASVDDFYLTRADREALARQTSPLFRTRGPPGTHDLPLLNRTITSLQQADPKTVTPIPVFDKLADDRAPMSAWRRFTGRPAAIVIEGWLMGALPDPAAPRSPPLNAVEEEDITGGFRRYQETALAGSYARLWDAAGSFCHIVPPGFEYVLAWRLQQEAALWASRGEPMPADRGVWVTRFIQHYERISRRMIAGRRREGMVIHIDAARAVIRTSGY
jgi:D-glycerate 3-kinase